MLMIIVLRVHLSCQKCKMKLMQAVAGLLGVNKIEIDSAKSTLTVTGDVDPVDVIKRTRKAGKFAEVVSIGPPPPPPPPPPKKPEEKPHCPPVIVCPPPACPPPVCPPATCTACHQVDPPITCSIL